MSCVSTFVPSSNQRTHACTHDKNHLVSIKAYRVTVPCQTIMTAPTSFAITSSFPGSHRVPTPLTWKRPIMATLTSLKIGVATHSAGRDFSAEPPHPLALALARARATRRPHDGTAHCRRHHAVSPTPASLPRPRRCSVLVGFAASTLAPSALPLFALTTSCHSPRRRRPFSTPLLLSSPIKGARP